MKKIRRWHLAIVADFDAGERDFKRLAAAHECSPETVRNVLQAAGRKLPNRSEAMKARHRDPAYKAKFAAAQVTRRRMNILAKLRPYYSDLTTALGRDAARAEILRQLEAA